MDNSEFISDGVIAAARLNLEDAAREGRDFIDVALGDNGDIFVIRHDMPKNQTFSILGTMAYMKKLKYVAILNDVRCRPPTEAEQAEYGVKGMKVHPTFPEGATEALTFLVISFTPDVAEATGQWPYHREGRTVRWVGDKPAFTPKVYKDAGIYQWVMSGYKAGELLGLREAKGRT